MLPKIVAIAILCLITLKAHALSSEELTANFSAYLAEYDLEVSSDDYEYRMQVYAENLESIGEMNELLGGGYGITDRAHLTDEEWPTCGCGASGCEDSGRILETREEEPTSLGHISEASYAVESVRNMPWETERRELGVEPIDWKKRGAVGPVRDQGSCGSCYVFATALAVESSFALYMAFLEGGMKNLDYAKYLPSISEQQIIDCNYGKGCDGGDPLAVKNFVMYRPSLCNKTNYPYKMRNYVEGEVPPKLTCMENEIPCPASFIYGKMYEYEEAKSTPELEKNLHGFLEAGAEEFFGRGPHVIGMRGDALLHFKGGPNDVLTNKACKTAIARNKKKNPDQNFWHAVVVVGFGSLEVKGKVQDYWLVQNSWGEQWGDQGLFKLERNAAFDTEGGTCMMFDTPRKQYPFSPYWKLPVSTKMPTSSPIEKPRACSI
mmetsp:Transcript_2781/g.3986  ORF Transcript_2781/g.3986 Transcript_2781/m.3986 type:complete len:435 (-) Transcript_2781:212-1516(-)|eukprot:CAMPEP_0203803514 /NCGR_PEP_ID=MMETSP0100_2-20121128/12899_1 /ASSEMBLY_ACC=CAM_ASM_000210 /TAXON_ID=96639 /ORGANISM=" , Strain NY0313808BC1" /LENGTH=434 /DNA_ID=CAMNT_0050711285 /DNA_START=96 /DNA_END=1400 /DNA_ORIENTATION=+